MCEFKVGFVSSMALLVKFKVVQLPVGCELIDQVSLGVAR
jgi:hypothetical protein